MAERRLIDAIPREIALAFAIGLTISFATGGLQLIDKAGWLTGARWGVFMDGILVAEVVMIYLGVVELRLRATGRLATLLTAILCARVLTALWTIAWPYVGTWIIHLEIERVSKVFEVIDIAWVALSVTTLVLSVVAARAWRTPLGIAAIAILVALELIDVPWIAAALQRFRIDHAQLAGAERILTGSLRAFAWLVVFGMIGQQAPIRPDAGRAARACQRAASWLYARLWIMAMLAALAVFLVPSSPSSLGVVFVAAAVLTLIATFGFVAALLALGNSGIAGLPVGRLFVAAVGVLWWTAVQIEHVFATYLWGARDLWGDSPGERAAVWTALGPLVMALAVAFGASALARFDDRDTLTARLAWFVVLNAAMPLLVPVIEPTSAGSILLFAATDAAFAIAALVALARAFRDAAERVTLASAADVF